MKRKNIKYLSTLITGALLCYSLQAQPLADYRAMDRHARNAPQALTTDLPALVAYLCEKAGSDAEKARAIYAWITTRIDYDEEAAKADHRINQHLGDILRRRKGICLDYAQLFGQMAELAGLQAEVVSGYSKGTLTAKPDLNEPDHAWNTVLLDGSWHLIDATWGSSVVQKDHHFVLIANDDYFLTPPRRFVLNHLPGDPRWQLLDCPVPAPVFARDPEYITAYLDTTATCYDFRDSIESFLELPPDQRRLLTHESTFRFHPSAGNQKQLGHALMDYAGILSDSAGQWQGTPHLDTLIRLQQQIIDLCQRAGTLTDLQNWQQELFAGTLINQAVALFRKVQQHPSSSPKEAYQDMTNHLHQARDLLRALPGSYFRTGALARCEDYLETIAAFLKN